MLNGKPSVLNLKSLISNYVSHRQEVIVRKTKFDLKVAEERKHLVEGFLKALDAIDAIILLIKKSRDANEALDQLMKTYDFSERQAKAILDMRLQRLTNLEQEKLKLEHANLTTLIADLKHTLEDTTKQLNIIKEDLEYLKNKYGDSRRTKIVTSTEDFSIEDIIPNEEMVITISNKGYIKRTPLVSFRTQARGGIGAKGASFGEEDFARHLLIATNHEYLLLFTNLGKLHWIKVHEVPESAKNTKGRPIQNLIRLARYRGCAFCYKSY